MGLEIRIQPCAAFKRFLPLEHIQIYVMDGNSGAHVGEYIVAFGVG